MTYYLHNNGLITKTELCVGEGLYCTPRMVVVIDPEDREQVERLAGLVLPLDTRPFPVHIAEALREFAAPTPPKCGETIRVKFADGTFTHTCEIDAGHEHGFHKAGSFSWSVPS